MKTENIKIMIIHNHVRDFGKIGLKIEGAVLSKDRNSAPWFIYF